VWVPCIALVLMFSSSLDDDVIVSARLQVGDEKERKKDVISHIVNISIRCFGRLFIDFVFMCDLASFRVEVSRKK